jgi:hypothetical protein
MVFCGLEATLVLLKEKNKKQKAKKRKAVTGDAFVPGVGLDLQRLI